MKNMMKITLAIPGAIPLHQMCYWWRITSANHLKGGWVDTYEPCHLMKYDKVEACMHENLSSALFSFLQIVMKIWYCSTLFKFNLRCTQIFSFFRWLISRALTLVTLLFNVHCSAIKIWGIHLWEPLCHMMQSHIYRKTFLKVKLRRKMYIFLGQILRIGAV